MCHMAPPSVAPAESGMMETAAPEGLGIFTYDEPKR